jgi:DNA polymerase-1
LAEVDQAKAIILTEMRNALTLGDVPVEVEAGTGDNWLKAH